MKAVRQIARLALAAGFGVASYWSVRLACADRLARQGTPESVRHAARLAPDSAEYFAMLSDWPGAVARNPYGSANWIQLALEAEGSGDTEAAEAGLLQAAAVDRLFEPRWSLANYYYRHSDWDSFWKWSAAAAEVSPEAPLALYRLCRNSTPDLGLIFDRIVAGRPRLTGSFLYWLEAQNELAGFRAVLPRAVEAAGPGETHALTACASRTLRLGAPADALRLWNRMIERGLLPFERLDPERGASLTNGDFRWPLKGETFNWRLLEGAGLQSRWSGDGTVRFEFSGSQPENCDLISQELPLLASRRYRLRWKYRNQGIESGTGPIWLAGDHASDVPAASAGWREEYFEFEPPPCAQTTLLRLAYRRVPGTTRIRGVLWLSDVRLDFAGQ